MRRLAIIGLALAAPGCDGETSVVAPTLAATCSATPSSGASPLAVSFNLNVSGAQGPFTVAINYGDGAAGTDSGAPHRFDSAGLYTVTFTVRTASQSALCSTSVNVTGAALPPPPPPSTLNQAPSPVFRTTPVAGPGDLIRGIAPLAVRFNLCGSTDPEQDRLYFTMDFQGDGAFDTGGTTGAQCRHDYVYGVGVFRPRVCVTDLGSDGVPMHPYQCQRYTVEAN